MRAACFAALLLTAACAAPLPRDPAASYEKLRERYARSGGIELDGTLITPGRSMQLRLRAAPPASGSLEIVTTDEFLGEAQTETQRWVGNGTAIYLLSEERRECLLTAGSWRQLEVLSQLDFLAPSWTLGQHSPAARVEWADPSRSTLRLFDSAGAPLREYRLSDGLISSALGWGEEGAWSFTAERTVLHGSGRAASFPEALPPDYLVLGSPYDEFNHLRGLLQPGEYAPEITLVNLDGSERHLSEFRGRPILIAFWFYH